MHVRQRLCISARSKANAWLQWMSYLLLIELDSAFNFPLQLGEVAVPAFQ